MSIEDFNSQRYKELGQVSAREQEKARLIEETLNRFERGLIDIITTDVRQVDLFSGDFVSQENPVLVQLSDFNGIPLTIEYSDIYKRFMQKIESDLKDKEFITQAIERYPEQRTEKLKRFIERHPKEKLKVIQQSMKLKGGRDWILILTTDRYMDPEAPKIPFAETWTLRKMFQDFSRDDKGDLDARYKLMPGPLVQA